jgi:hypothetical protein
MLLADEAIEDRFLRLELPRNVANRWNIGICFGLDEPPCGEPNPKTSLRPVRESGGNLSEGQPCLPTFVRFEAPWKRPVSVKNGNDRHTLKPHVSDFDIPVARKVGDVHEKAGLAQADMPR